jgi:uncharacterized protein (TIGR03437 family)
MLGSVVKVGGKIAEIVSSTPTPTQLQVKVPKGTKKGRVTVTVTVGGVTSNVGYYTYK